MRHLVLQLVPEEIYTPVRAYETLVLQFASMRRFVLQFAPMRHFVRTHMALSYAPQFADGQEAAE
jgi:hypothetical protein